MAQTTVNLMTDKKWSQLYIEGKPQRFSHSIDENGYVKSVTNIQLVAGEHSNLTTINRSTLLVTEEGYD